MTKEFILLFFAVFCAVISMIVKNFSKQFSSLISLAATVFFVLFFIGYITPVISYINEILSLTGFEEYFRILIKAIGISIAVSVVCEICRDMGENGIAEKTEICGKAILLYMSLPIIKKLFEYIEEFSKM